MALLTGHVYTLRCEAYSNRMLDLAAGNSNNGTAVIGYHPETLHPNAFNQFWILTLIGGTTDVYTVQNLRSGTYLDVVGGNKKNGTAIVGYSWNRPNNPNQYWRVYECEWNGRHRLQNIASGTFLDLPNPADFHKVHAWSKQDNNPHQMWNLVRVSRTAEEVRNALESPYVNPETFKSYRADAVYVTIPRDVRQEIWTGSGLKDAEWRESVFDCDDFAFVAKAAVSNYAKSNIKGSV
ncbi:ricin B lectin domain-containing protein [Roridomyces roridus]|uniref:Ricin B lectin domain-containing protein n=1 Tax=Roridomyces roridus TaxID=1738132 RepID=A0AAD7FI33_9AGAR|nr:ricin B lectin domain-containing protein [Roridomyces roridus]